MFNLNIDSVLGWFFGFNLLKYNYHSKSIFILVFSVKMFEVFVFFLSNNPKIIIIYLVSCYMNVRRS